MSVSHPRLQRGAGLVVTAAVGALLVLGASRAVASVHVANAATFNLTVNAGSSSPSQAIPSSSGNPTILTVTSKTANDGIRGIASFAVAYVADAPQSIVWTGTARGAVVGGEAKVANVNLGSCGPGLTIQTELNGASLNRFKIVNVSGLNSAINIHEVW